jgi:hypothetical protein
MKRVFHVYCSIKHERAVYIKLQSCKKSRNQQGMEKQGETQRFNTQNGIFIEILKNNTKISLTDSPLLRKTPEKRQKNSTHRLTTPSQTPIKTSLK